MANCRACNRPVPEGADKCPVCYTPVEIKKGADSFDDSFPPQTGKPAPDPAGTRPCPKCARNIPGDAKECPHCHTKIGWLSRLKSSIGVK